MPSSCSADVHEHGNRHRQNASWQHVVVNSHVPRAKYFVPCALVEHPRGLGKVLPKRLTKNCGSDTL